MAAAIPDVPILGERNCRSLRSILMPSQLPTTNVQPQDHQGVHPCQSDRCVICRLHLNTGKTFTSQITKQTFNIRYTLSCNSSNVIYILFCNTCNHTQYVGMTKNTLKQRFYLHRSNINKNTGTLVAKHFNQKDITLANLKCMPIEQLFTDDQRKRLARERFWMEKLKTLNPNGHNIIE